MISGAPLVLHLHGTGKSIMVTMVTTVTVVIVVTIVTIVTMVTMVTMVMTVTKVTTVTISCHDNPNLQPPYPETQPPLYASNLEWGMERVS